MAENARLFMSLSGPSGAIRGESRVVSKQDWIEIEDWDWKLDPGENRDDSAAVRPTVLAFSKQMDRASGAMLGAMHNGDVLSADIQLEDDSLQMFDLSMRLQKVRIVGYEMRTQTAAARQSIVERWLFDYEAMLLVYRPDLKSGASQVRLERPPGSSNAPPDNRVRTFTELSEDLSPRELEQVWTQLRRLRETRLGDKDDNHDHDPHDPEQLP